MLPGAWLHLGSWGCGCWCSRPAWTQGCGWSGWSASRQLSRSSLLFCSEADLSRCCQAWSQPEVTASCPHSHGPAAPSWCCVWLRFPLLVLILIPTCWVDISAWLWSVPIPWEVLNAQGCPPSLSCFWLGQWDQPWLPGLALPTPEEPPHS